MSYARVFVRGWSRREWLTVVVVAITTAFLLGTALLLASAGAYTETLEDDLSSTATVAEYDSLAAARAAANTDDVVVPLATADVEGEQVTVAGVPPDAPTVLSGASVAWQEARIPDTSTSAVGPVAANQTVTFVGDGQTVELRVRPTPGGESGVASETIFPPWWYAAPTSAVERLGVSSVLVFDSDGGTGGAVPTGRAAPPGTPLIAALPFLLAGVRELLGVLSVAALGGGVVVLVVVYSVTRMAIRDRHDDIRVVRATGGSPRTLFAVLCGRAGALVLTGVALGYALGVVLTNAVTNLAVIAGFPVTLSGTVTPAIARLLLFLAGVLVLAGLVAGALAAWPAVSTPPAQLRSRAGQRAADRTGVSSVLSGGETERADGGRPRESVRERLRPTLLDSRAAIPTAATLTVFVFVVLLVGALWGAFVPLTGAQSGTIVESGAAHPLNSRVDADTADLLQSQGINASAEVIYAAVRDGQPYLVRGANYSDFARVSDARLVAGRAPESIDEAVIGRALARTLDVDVGETVVLGGSVTPGVRRVTVVGVYAAGETVDDMLVLPLEATQGLATSPGQAHIIRTEDLSAAQQVLVADRPTRGVVITGIDAPAAVAVGEAFSARVSLRNLDDTATQSTVVVRRTGTNDTLGRQTVSLDGGATREVTFDVALDETGATTLDVDGYTTTVRVFDPEARSIPAELPTRGPPGATLIVPVEAPNGSFVAGATVTLAGESYETGGEGVAVVRLPSDPGTYQLGVVDDGEQKAQREFRVVDGAPRQLSARLGVTPKTGNALTKPRVDVQVANPWRTRLNRTLTLVTPQGRTTRTVELAGGEATRVNVSTSDAGLDQRFPPGEYTLRLVSSGGGETATLATTTYRVRGDDRVLSVVASGGRYTPGTPVGQAIENVFGNVQVLFAAIVLLAGCATIGGTTAAFAQAVHARGRTIGIRRATGATPRQLLRVMTLDALKIAFPSTVVAVVVAWAGLAVLSWAGLLVVFGIRLTIPLALWVVAMVFIGGLALSVVSVAVAASGFLRGSPARLLRLRE